MGAAMKLHVVHINAERGSEPYIAMIDQMFGQSKRDDTEIIHRFAAVRRASDLVFAYPNFLNTASVVHEIASAAIAGADGMMVACSGDPGVTEARTLVDVPVVGPWEASVHLATQYAYRFGIVTVQDRAWAEICHATTVKYGLIDRCVGLERIDTSSMEAFTRGFVDPTEVIADIERKARILVERGAGAIVLGSAGLSTIAAFGGLTQLNDLNVPIFDVLTVGLKTLELRVDLSAKAGLPVIARNGMFERFPDNDASRVRHQLGYDDAVVAFQN
jgi:allantoin racemase